MPSGSWAVASTLLAWRTDASYTARMGRSAVIFDFDGTLTKPHLDFDAIRADIGVGGPILEAMAGMDGRQRERAERILLEHEWQAARHAVLQEDAAEVVAACRATGRPVAILTRNARAPVQDVLSRFSIQVDALRTREDGATKPSPEPVLAICRTLGTEARSSWVVGDFLFDVQSGSKAGARTVLMIGDGATPPYAHEADHVIRRLRELLPLLDA